VRKKREHSAKCSFLPREERKGKKKIRKRIALHYLEGKRARNEEGEKISKEDYNAN